MAVVMGELDRFFAAGDVAGARDFLERSLQQALESGEEAALLPLANELIGCYRETGAAEASFQMAARALALVEKQGYAGTLVEATTLLNGANAYRAGGRLEDSLACYRKAWPIYDRELLPGDMRRASYYNNLSLLYQEMGKYEQAREALLSALAIVVQNPQAKGEEASTYANLAATSMAMGLESEAAAYEEKALEGFERAGIEDGHYAAALSARGMRLYRIGEVGQAYGCFDKAQRIVRRIFGDTPFAQRLEENKQACLEAMGEQAGAFRESLEAERAREKSVGGSAGENLGRAGQIREESAGGSAGENLGKAGQIREESIGGSAGENLGKAGQIQEESAGGSVGASGADMTGAEAAKKSGREDAPALGLDLSRAYFFQVVQPMLDEEFPGWRQYLAVGLVGEGSDCFGLDDALSRDHDWGPDVCLWISREDYAQMGAALEEAYGRLPREFGGYARKDSPAGRRGVLVREDFWQYFLGAEDADCMDWEQVPDHMLAAASNGEVFVDESGAFSWVWNQLRKGYPQGLRLRKLAQACGAFAQEIQYNLPRLQERGDRLGSAMMLGAGMGNAMRCAYYIDGLYPPHSKAMWKGLEAKPRWAKLGEGLEALARAQEAASREDRVRESRRIGAEIALALWEEMAKEGLTGGISGWYMEDAAVELAFRARWVEKSSQELAEAIVRREFAIFDRVKNLGGRADCQDDWQTFSIMRKSQYLCWDRIMQEQYFWELDKADREGRNLVEEKYARMMESTAPEEYAGLRDRLPVVEEGIKPIIEAICSIQVGMMEEMLKKHPALQARARSLRSSQDGPWNTSYETYLRGELGTYSPLLVNLYGRMLARKAGRGENFAQEILEQSARLYGYADLAESLV